MGEHTRSILSLVSQALALWTKQGLASHNIGGDTTEEGGGSGRGRRGGGAQWGPLEVCIRHLIRLHKGSRRQASHVLHKAAHGGHAGAAPHQQHLTDGGPPLRPQLGQGGCLPLALAPPLLLHLLIWPDRPQIHPCLHALPTPLE